MSKIIYGVLVFLCQGLFLQSIENEEKYKLLALNVFFSEGLNTDRTIINEENVIKFFGTTNLTIKKLYQENFEKIHFFSVNQKEFDANEKIDLSLPIIWDSSSCEGYIIAVLEDSNYTFKLKGFKINEFFNFYRYLKNKKYLHTKNKKEFIKNYKVEGLDFKCLFASLNLKLSEDDLEDYPCVSDTCLKVFKTHNF